MADNTTLNAGSGGDTYGSDDIAGVKYQRVKLIHGADGTNAGDVADGNPLPIYAPSAVLASQSGNWTVYAITQPLPIGTNNLGNVGLLDSEDGRLEGATASPSGTENGLIVRNIPSGTQAVSNAGTFAVQSAQSGNWSVRAQDGAGTALTSATRGSEQALSVQIVDGSGNQVTSFSGGTQYTEGDTDASITGTAILWEDSGNALSTVSTASPLPVTVANPASQVDSSAFTVTTDSAIPVMGLYESSASTLTTGQVGAVGVTASREMKVSLTTALPAGTNNIGKVFAVGAVNEDDPLAPTTTPGVPFVAYATATTKSAVSADGDAVHVAADRTGQLLTVSKLYTSGGTALSAGAGAVGTGVLRVTLPTDGNGTIAGITTSIVPGTSATHLGKAEDAAHSSGDVGVMALAVRNDAGTALAGTTGDYIPITTDSAGAVWVNVTNVNSQTDDAAFTAATSTGVGFMGAATTDSVDSGDFGVLAMTTKRELHTVKRCVGAGLTTARGVSAATTNLTAISSNACLVKSFSVCNNHATNEAYLRFYNIASGSVTVGTSSIAAGPFIIPPADSGHTVNFDCPLEFATACSFSITGAIADNDTTAVAATQVAWTIQHKDA